MTTHAVPHTRPAPRRRPGARQKSGWPIPVALVVLSLIPVISGSLRLVEIAGGPQLMPTNPRIDASPAPLVVHVLGAALYAILGAFQFSARLRRRHLSWHRRSGRILVVAGLAVAGSGLWMTLFYAGAPGGHLLWGIRLVVSSAMGAILVLGFAAIRRREISAHRAWMIRAYALGLGAGTQAFTEGIGEALMGTTDLSKAISLGSAWLINAIVAELVIRRPAARRTGRARAHAGPRWRGRDEPTTPAVRASPLRAPDRRAPRRALVGLVRRTDPHLRERRHHHPARPGGRPGRAARTARQGARPRHHPDLSHDHPRGNAANDLNKKEPDMTIPPPTMTRAAAAAPTTGADLSLTRLHLMRAGYLFMGVGLALVKWPLLPDAAALPLFEGVTLCLLTAMSLLAFLGLRYPVKLLPLLLFESAWKLLWLSLVALPKATTGPLDAATTQTVVNCSLVVVILAVTPWRYVWRNYVRATGDRWR